MRGGNAISVAASARPNRHESFLAYSRYRYLWSAALIVAVAVVLYIVDRPYGTRSYG